jgi:hypothetical protein
MLHLVDHAADTVVILVRPDFTNVTKAQAFYNFAVGFRLTDEATLLRHNDLAHFLLLSFDLMAKRLTGDI